MATKKQKEELIQVLKFTPVTVQVLIQGYGGESYAGTVDRKIYDYFKEHKIDLEEFANDWDDENFAFVPEEMRPFSSGQQYDCDNMWHASGAELDGSNVITVSGPDGDIWEHNMDYSELENAGVTVEESGGCDLDDEDIPEGQVVYNGAQGEKGCFFDGEFVLRAPFDPKKLTIHYENCGGWYLVTYVEYDGEEIDGSGCYSTTGKWGENKWILPGGEEVYESVSVEDRDEWDPAAELDKIRVPDEFDWAPEIDFDDVFATEGKTDWFPADIDPVRKGYYDVDLGAAVQWPNSRLIRAKWTGQCWQDNNETITITAWRGLATDPII